MPALFLILVTWPLRYMVWLGEGRPIKCKWTLRLYLSASGVTSFTFVHIIWVRTKGVKFAMGMNWNQNRYLFFFFNFPLYTPRNFPPLVLQILAVLLNITIIIMSDRMTVQYSYLFSAKYFHPSWWLFFTPVNDCASHFLHYVFTIAYRCRQFSS